MQRTSIPDDFAGDRKLQVIHIGQGWRSIEPGSRNGRATVVKNIDSDDSTVNAVVSVMMLREGWDVRNVTVVLGLRPYTCQREHSAGAGHRARAAADVSRRHAGYEERVDVIGTDKFMEFVADLENEVGPIATETLGDGNPIIIVTIHPDYANKGAMDIAIPNISPIYERSSNTREAVANLNVDDIEIDHLPFSLDPQR